MITLIFDGINIQPDNNDTSTEIKTYSQKAINKRCQQVLDLLNSGLRLTVKKCAAINISSLPRRVKDLRDWHQIPVKTEYIKGIDENGEKFKYAEYFL